MRLLRIFFGFFLRYIPSDRFADLLLWPIYRRVFGRGYSEVVLILPQMKMKVYGDMPDMVNKVLLFASPYRELAWEPVTARLVKRLSKQVKIAVVAGSHIGYYPLLLASSASLKKVCAFEPDPRNFGRLSYNVTLNNVTTIETIPAALGDTNTQREMFFDAGQSSLVDTHRPAVSKGIVEVKMLDTFCTEKSIAPDLLILDAEGYEPHILKGGAGVVSKYHPDIVVEINPKTLISSGSSPHILCDSLKTQGYSLFVIQDDYHHRLYDREEPVIRLKKYRPEAVSGISFINLYATIRPEEVNDLVYTE